MNREVFDKDIYNGDIIVRASASVGLDFTRENYASNIRHRSTYGTGIKYVVYIRYKKYFRLWPI